MTDRIIQWPSGAPMPSLAEARRGAVDDVVRQVLGAIGAKYDQQYGKGHVGEESA